MSRKVTWKIYDQGQLSLLPPSYDDLVPQNHPVRIVNTILDSVDLSSWKRPIVEAVHRAIIPKYC